MLAVLHCGAQDCNFKVQGKVLDQATGLPLPNVNIIIQEKTTGTATNQKGYFKIKGLCKGEYHFILSHIGCESKRIHIDLSGDTTLN
ncbi:MAG: carboxypeptidase-like regulatory domain-containing protein, partial [Bacteroidia bacterium]|nr:carboxypeptidase-like regulatory domain-containing protein [Bacteroidia bacterium]